LIDDSRFNTNLKRLQNRDVIMPIFEEKMRARNSDEWLRLFDDAGLPAGLILDIKEVFQDPHLSAREMLLEIDHPIAGAIKQLGFPYKFSLTNPRVNSRPPLLGEHNEEVLSGILNYSKEEIDNLKSSKVI